MNSNEYSYIPSFKLYDECKIYTVQEGEKQRVKVISTLITYSISEYGGLLEDQHYETDEVREFFLIHESKDYTDHKLTRWDHENSRRKYLYPLNTESYLELQKRIQIIDKSLEKIKHSEFANNIMWYLIKVELAFQQWFNSFKLRIPEYNEVKLDAFDAVKIIDAPQWDNTNIMTEPVQNKETTTNLLENANSSVSEERISAEEDIDSTSFENKKPLTVLAREILNKKDVKEEVMKKLHTKQCLENRKWQLSTEQVVLKYFKGFKQKSTLIRYVKRFRSGTL